MRVRGVAAVADEIVVQHLDVVHTDADIAREAGRARPDRGRPGRLGARDGPEHTITLTGSVGWEYQRHAAQRPVAGIPGVKGVRNRIE